MACNSTNTAWLTPCSKNLPGGGGSRDGGCDQFRFYFNDREMF